MMRLKNFFGEEEEEENLKTINHHDSGLESLVHDWKQLKGFKFGAGGIWLLNDLTYVEGGLNLFGINLFHIRCVFWNCFDPYLSCIQSNLKDCQYGYLNVLIGWSLNFVMKI